jgi:hypothetical protein
MVRGVGRLERPIGTVWPRAIAFQGNAQSLNLNTAPSNTPQAP